MTPASPIPRPPAELLDASGHVKGSGRFAPALELEAWIWTEILSEDRPLSNYGHGHLSEHSARIGLVWSTERYHKSGRRILGTAQRGEPTGSAWSAGRQRQQLREWFGNVPDFLILLDAWHADHAIRTEQPQNFLAVLEHELYHCAQDRTADGDPRFTQDGEPVWGIRPHDTEEFAGVIQRYGVGASPNASPLASAIEYVREHGPDVAQSTLDGLCGTCKRSLQLAA